MDANKKAMLRNIRQALVVTLVLLLFVRICISGASERPFRPAFPASGGRQPGDRRRQGCGCEAGGTGVHRGLFHEAGRPSAYHYNTYYTDEQGSRFYNDGSEFAGLGSGSNNYAPSNPALTQRVEADIEAFLAENPGVAREDIPADLMTASGRALTRTSRPPPRRCSFPPLQRLQGSARNGLRRSLRTTPRKTAGRVRGGDRERAGREPGHRAGDGADFGNGKINAAEAKKRRPETGRRLLYTAPAGRPVTSPGRAASTGPCAPAAPHGFRIPRSRRGRCT